MHCNFRNQIFANSINIGKNVIIDPLSKIICDKIEIGDGSVIIGSSKITCKECVIGKNNFFNSIWIEASLNAGNTQINIGDENLILQNSRLNCNDIISIGNDVNIGQNVTIWTHASSMDVFKGYPFTAKSVEIGSHIWVTAGTSILRGVKIGSNVVIGNMSLVNRDIPSGCFAAGSPVKIIKENIYPRKLKFEEKFTILQDCINNYLNLAKLKSFSPDIELNEELIIKFCIDGKLTFFDCFNRKMSGDINKYSEDFRDFLRYRGIKIFTGKPFQSIKPDWYQKCIMKKD